ncbi:MAG: hypothetical protein M9894_39820 [Planctomycetes bacterium]|nr:hypothetical protein [Planctomycetota bacterium]
MQDERCRVAWTLLCPRHRVRAELVFDLTPGWPAVAGCSLLGPRRRCDEECAAFFGRDVDPPTRPLPEERR